MADASAWCRRPTTRSETGAMPSAEEGRVIVLCGTARISRETKRPVVEDSKSDINTWNTSINSMQDYN
jgi:hypothetical protein